MYSLPAYPGSPKLQLWSSEYESSPRDVASGLPRKIAIDSADQLSRPRNETKKKKKEKKKDAKKRTLLAATPVVSWSLSLSSGGGGGGRKKGVCVGVYVYVHMYSIVSQEPCVPRHAVRPRICSGRSWKQGELGRSSLFFCLFFFHY